MMASFRINIVSIGFLILLISCAVKSKTGNANFHDNLNGIYTGILPCEDCEGIKTVLKLKVDKSFILESQHENKNFDMDKTEGSYKINKKAATLTLIASESQNSSKIFQIKGDSMPYLQLIDSNKTTTKEFNLIKKTNALLEQYWKLIDVKGKPVTSSSKEAYIIFKIINGSASGNGGCNSFSGKYNIPKGNSIKISRVISTKMACDNIEMENDFLNSLELVDNYLLSNDTLSLRKGTSETLLLFIRDNK